MMPSVSSTAANRSAARGNGGVVRAACSVPQGVDTRQGTKFRGGGPDGSEQRHSRRFRLALKSTILLLGAT